MRINLQDLLRSEASQIQKVRRPMTFLVCNLKTNHMTSVLDSEVDGTEAQSRAVWDKRVSMEVAGSTDEVTVPQSVGK